MFLEYITLFSGLNYIIFSAILFSRKSVTKKANKILGFLFALLALYSILVSFYYTALETHNLNLLSYYVPFDLILLFSLGPCLFFYVKVLLGQNIRFNPFYHALLVIQYIPAISFIVYFLIQDNPTRINLLITNFEKGLWHINLLNILVYIQMITYLLFSYRIINIQLKKSIWIVVAKVQINVSWLKSYVILNLTFLLITAPLTIYIANENTNLIIAQIAMVIQFMYLFVRSTWQTGLLPTEAIIRTKNGDKISKISSSEYEAWFNKLNEYMNEQKPHLEENCSIQIVSENVGLSVHLLSNILNQRINKNFSDFINDYRVEEAKKLLTNSGRIQTIEAVGFECGFGSKSAFNKAFKKNCNLTPSQYMKNYSLENFK